MGEMTVELADLRAWAAQVERAAEAVSGIGGEATGTIADGDFGKILELITDDYESMLPTFHALLPEEGERLDRTADALREVARDLRDTDTRVAESFGGTGWVHDDHHAPGFDDVVDAGPRCPSSAGYGRTCRRWHSAGWAPTSSGSRASAASPAGRSTTRPATACPNMAAPMP